ncbi:hypothetical protein NBRC3279_2798 [Acetobacter pasteurianus NBRC 3279]|nr:hypothetical protein NBRC3279_2798 [Acetobacter pasteurianus NBRC 3279]
MDDGFVVSQTVGLEVELRAGGLWPAGDLTQMRLQVGLTIDGLAIPGQRVVKVHNQRHHRCFFRAGRRVALRQINRDCLRLQRDGDDQHDQQHQHHVNQRRGVDVDNAFIFRGAL